MWCHSPSAVRLNRHRMDWGAIDVQTGPHEGRLPRHGARDAPVVEEQGIGAEVPAPQRGLAEERGRSSTARSPPTTPWACTTPGAAPTRTSSSATRPCRASASATRTASTARACGSRSRSRRSSASRSKRDIEELRHRPLRRALQGACAQVRGRSRPSSRSAWATGWTGTTPTTRCPTRTTTPSGTSSRRATSAGWLYKGHDVMPWCPRCGTGLSEHEIVTEGYRELTHTGVFVALPADRSATGESLLVWTTTPWTLTVQRRRRGPPRADLRPRRARASDDLLPAPRPRLERRSGRVTRCSSEVARRGARWACDLPRPVRRAAAPQQGVDAPRDPLGRGRARPRAPASSTSLPGCGKEDFDLGKELGLAVIAPLDEYGVFLEGFGWLDGTRRPRRRRGRSSTTCRQGAPLSRRGLHAPLPRLLALRQRAGLPAGRRVVHLHGRAARRRSCDVAEQDPLDPGVRPGARARLARATWTTG